MISLPTYMLIALLAVCLPIFSFTIWVVIFFNILPGSYALVKRILRRDRAPSWRRDVSLTMGQLLFYTNLMISVPTSVLLEIGVLIPVVLAAGADSGIGQTFVVSSAGPIEESAKLLSSITLYFLIILSFGRIGHGIEGGTRSKIRIGILSGLYCGACFGFIESIGYLVVGLENLFMEGLGIHTIDEVVWRIVLGVSIHAMFTGLASGGLGRYGWSSKMKVTAILLSLSILLHTMNNGIQGMIFLVFELNDDLAYLLTDSLQAALAMVGFILLVLVWRGKILQRGSEEPHSDDEMYRSKRIYARPIN